LREPSFPIFTVKEVLYPEMEAADKITHFDCVGT